MGGDLLCRPMSTHNEPNEMSSSSREPDQPGHLTDARRVEQPSVLVRTLRCTYGDNEALSGINLEIAGGQTLASSRWRAAALRARRGASASRSGRPQPQATIERTTTMATVNTGTR